MDSALFIYNSLHYLLLVFTKKFLTKDMEICVKCLYKFTFNKTQVYNVVAIESYK